MNRQEWPAQSPLAVGLKAVCPRCGEGRLYDGLLTPAGACTACGLDYSFIDSGDGPAVLVILVLGFIVLGLALLIDAVLSPPVWLQILVWIPVIVASSLWALRVSKAAMIALQYRADARQGELE